MGEKNKKVLSIAVILILTILVEITISIIFWIDYNSQIKEQYNQISKDTAKSITSAVETDIKNYVKQLDECEINEVTSETNIPTNFDAVAVVTKRKDNAIINNMKYNIKGSGYGEYWISDSVYSELSTNAISGYSMEQLLNGSVALEYKLNYVIFTKGLINGDILLLFLENETLLQNISNYSFENLFLVSTDGRQISGTNKEIKLPTGLTDIYKLDGINLTYITDLYVSSQITLGYATKLRLVAHTPSPKIQIYITNFTGKLVVLLCSIIILSALGAVYTIYFYSKKYNYILFYNGKNSSNFVVKTDKFGNVRYANETFKSLFNTKNLFNHFLEILDPPSMLLAKAAPIKAGLVGTDGNDYVISFLSVATYNGYKFVGGDDTKLIKEFNLANELCVLDSETNLYIEKRLRENYNKTQTQRKELLGVFGVVEPIKTNKFEQMFGKSFHTTLMKVLSSRVVELFSPYADIYIQDEQFEIITKLENSNLATMLPDIMDKLNSPIEVLNNLIKLDFKAGFTILDKYLADFSFDSIKENSISALRRSLISDEHYYVVHQSQIKLYKPYRALEVSIEELILNGSIEVYYQPQFSLSTNRICGFEALTRLKGAISQELSIQQFINISETKGDMIKLSDHIYEKAMDFVSQIQDYNVEVSLNVSPVQLMQTGFAETFINKFNRHKLKKGSICLEITETFLMSSFDEIVPKLQVLHDNGIKIHLDDFGIAYSSMLYLKKLPISAIKIDREFIRDIEVNSFSKAITQSIINITKHLKLQSIAEGIEELGQKKCLTEIGCDIIQGYLVGQAMPKEKAILKLKEDYDANNFKTE